MYQINATWREHWMLLMLMLLDPFVVLDLLHPATDCQTGCCCWFYGSEFWLVFCRLHICTMFVRQMFARSLSQKKRCCQPGLPVYYVVWRCCCVAVDPGWHRAVMWDWCNLFQTVKRSRGTPQQHSSWPTNVLHLMCLVYHERIHHRCNMLEYKNAIFGRSATVGAT